MKNKILSIIIIFAMVLNTASFNNLAVANDVDVTKDQIETTKTEEATIEFEQTDLDEIVKNDNVEESSVDTNEENETVELAEETKEPDLSNENNVENTNNLLDDVLVAESVNNDEIEKTNDKEEIEEIKETKKLQDNFGTEIGEPYEHVLSKGWFDNSGFEKSDITKITIQKSDDEIKISNVCDIDENGLKGYINDKNELILNCKSIDNIKIESAEDLFSGFTNVVELKGLGNLDTSETTNMNSMFFNMQKIEKIDFEDLDVSSLTDAKLMFSQTYNLKNIDFSNFASSNFINAKLMFYHSGVEKVDFTGKANFINCEHMFSYSANLKEVIFADSDTSKLEDLTDIFTDCEKLEKVDFTNCDLSNVWKRDFLFEGCIGLKEMLFDGVKFMENANQFFNGVPAKTITLKNADFSNTTNIHRMFANCSNLEKLDLSYLDFSKIKDADSLIYQCYNLRELDLSGADFEAFRNTSFNIGMMVEDSWGDVESLSRKGIPTIKLNNIILKNKNYVNKLFNSDIASHIEKLEFDGVSFPADVSYLFNRLSSVKNISLENVDTSNAENMSYMFENCEKLESIDLSSFNTSNSTDMSNMFKNCKSLKSIDVSNFNTEKLEFANGMFDGCSNLLTLNMFATKNLLKINNMFNECNKIVELDLSNFKTDKVLSTTNFLNNCYGIKELNLSKFSNINIDLSTLTNLQKIILSEKIATKILKMNLTGKWLNEDTNEVVFFNEEFTQTGTATYIKTDAVSITFNVDGGSFIPPVNVSKGSTVNLNEYKNRTVKSGFAVEGFYKDEKFEQKLDDNFVVDEDITIYAKWIDTPYKVSLVVDNDKVFWKSTPSNITRLGADKYILPTADSFISDCYDFVGWCDNWKLKYDIYEEIPANTFEDKTFYAKFEPKKFKINYVLNGGSFDDEETEEIFTEYTYGRYVDLPKYVKGPNEREYIKGWYVNEDFSGEKYIDVPEGWYGEKTFYAKYAKRYKVVYDPDLEQVSRSYFETTSTQWFFEDEDATLSPIMFRDALNMYTFIEWQTKDGTVYKNKQHIGFLTDDLYLYGKWKYTGLQQIVRVQRTGGSSSGGGGGGGGGSVVPQNNNKPLLPNEGLPGYIPLESQNNPNYVEPIPTVTNVNSDFNIKQTIYANDWDAKWVYVPTTCKWQFEKAGQKAKEGFYKITRTDDYLINGVNVPIYSDLSIYYFDKDGNMVTGWVNDAQGNTYFFENCQGITEGQMLRGAKKIQGDIYYFDIFSGHLYKDETVAGYKFGSDGKLVA